MLKRKFNRFHGCARVFCFSNDFFVSLFKHHKCCFYFNFQFMAFVHFVWKLFIAHAPAIAILVAFFIEFHCKNKSRDIPQIWMTVFDDGGGAGGSGALKLNLIKYMVHKFAPYSNEYILDKGVDWFSGGFVQLLFVYFSPSNKYKSKKRTQFIISCIRQYTYTPRILF